ncbi:MAG TPA: HD domain-containing protein, partial [Planctomycetaceae bacterium]|nr:HD domain-containing protein [Planctomycetaceae bacterium]
LKYGNHTAVIMMTGFSDVQSAVKALHQGAFDYLEKPLTTDLLRFRINQALERRRLQKRQHQYVASIEKAVRERTNELQRAWRGTIFALARLAESRDDETGTHLIRLRNYTVAIAQSMRQMGLYPGILTPTFIDWLKDTAPLHDIGKVGIPDSILLKRGTLTPEEFDQMKAHTIIGARALEDVQRRVGEKMFLDIGIQVARSHHERMDGNGYPDALRGEEIPLAARIVSVADAYDALSQSRVYRPKAFSHEKAMKMIRDEAGDKFDPDVVTALERIQDEVREIAARLVDEP